MFGILKNSIIFEVQTLKLLVMTNQKLWNWDTVKDRLPDLRGIENPQEWKYSFVDGMFKPVEKVVKEVVEVDPMFDELDPDWTDEEMIEHGFVILLSVSIGDNGSTDLRQGCGHRVIGMEQESPKEVRKVGFFV